MLTKNLWAFKDDLQVWNGEALENVEKKNFLEELRPLDRKEKSEMLSMENRMNMQDLKSKLARVARLEEINW